MTTLGIMNASTPLIHVHDFHMHFGQKRVIEGLSFDVERGETFGFLGSNGSGKRRRSGLCWASTVPRREPWRSTAKVFNDDFGSLPGYLPGERGLYKKESVRDVMAYFGRLKGMSRTDALNFSQRYLKRVDLVDKANVRIDKLSGGEQQKIQLGVTIMNEPTLENNYAELSGEDAHGPSRCCWGSSLP